MADAGRHDTKLQPLRQSQIDAARLQIEIKQRLGEDVPDVLYRIAAATPRAEAQTPGHRQIQIQAARAQIEIKQRLGEEVPDALRRLAAATATPTD